MYVLFRTHNTLPLIFPTNDDFTLVFPIELTIGIITLEIDSCDLRFTNNLITYYLGKIYRFMKNKNDSSHVIFYSHLHLLQVIKLETKLMITKKNYASLTICEDTNFIPILTS